ncbi:MAG: SCO family protein [Bacillota bacterium]
MDKKSICVIIGIIIFGSVFLFISTDWLQAFTAEQARRIHVFTNTPAVPNVTFEDSKSDTFPLSAYRWKYILATYIYTTCGDVCPLVEINFHSINSQIPENILGDQLQLFSISFDTERDTPHHLEHHRQMFQADGIDSRMVRVHNQQELDLLLEQSGVIVIPVENSFDHNAAFYLINPDGQLIRIFDHSSPEEVIDELKKILLF